jgi:hypothetical protein
VEALVEKMAACHRTIEELPNETGETTASLKEMQQTLQNEITRVR